jgi:hypothetical protein
MLMPFLSMLSMHRCRCWRFRAGRGGNLPLNAKGFVVMRVIDCRICYRQIDGSYSPELNEQTDLKEQRERCFALARAEKGLTVWIEGPSGQPMPKSKRPQVAEINAQLEKPVSNKRRREVVQLIRGFRLQMAATNTLPT